MKPIFIKTESGATIEIECNGQGMIFIRHSQFQPTVWAELKAHHQDKSTELTPKQGGYVIIGGREFRITSIELEAIKSAVNIQAASAAGLSEANIPEEDRHATNELVSVVLTIQQYLVTYGKMIEEMAQRRQSLLSPVQRETFPIVAKQILDLEARLELLRRKVER